MFSHNTIMMSAPDGWLASTNWSGSQKHAHTHIHARRRRFVILTLEWMASNLLQYISSKHPILRIMHDEYALADLLSWAS